MGDPPAFGDHRRRAQGERDAAGRDAASDDVALHAAALEALAGEVGELARSHGGSIALESVRDGVVTVRMRGACAGCPAAGLTLHARLERELRHRVPGLVEIRSVDGGSGRTFLGLIGLTVALTRGDHGSPGSPDSLGVRVRRAGGVVADLPHPGQAQADDVEDEVAGLVEQARQGLDGAGLALPAVLRRRRHDRDEVGEPGEAESGSVVTASTDAPTVRACSAARTVPRSSGPPTATSVSPRAGPGSSSRRRRRRRPRGATAASRTPSP